MAKYYFLVFSFILFSLSSCENDDTFTKNIDYSLKADVNQEISRNISEGDSIIELSNSTLKKKSQKVRTYSYGDDTGIDGIVNMPVNLVIKQNPFSKRYITYKGENAECKLEDASNQDNQMFFLRTMPLTGLFYFAPKEQPTYLLSSGAYSSKPNIPVLYVKNSTSSIGATWDIKKGSSDDRAIILYNEDLLEQGSGGWWDVYNLALGVNSIDRNLNFSKYTNQKTQEFEIRPCDDFEIKEMQLSQFGTSDVVDIPDFVVTEIYSNNGSVEQQMSTRITKKAQRTSTFNRKTALSFNISSSIKVGAFFFENKITMSAGANYEWSYGENQVKSDDREYNFPLVIAPYKKVEVKIMVARKQANINYRAKMHGINTGYDIWEEGTWENVDCTTIIVDLKEYDLRTGAVTGTKQLNSIPTTPFRF